MSCEIISHQEVVDLLRLTMLVYNYGKDFTIDEDQDLEGFLSSIKKGENEDKLAALNEERKEALIEIAKGSPHGKILHFVTEETTDLQCGITVSHAKKRLNVIFRGSESLSDWYYDLKLFKHKLDEKYQPDDNNNVHVHVGFFEQLTKNGSYDKIIDILKEALTVYEDYHIFISGHSLGGALCTLFGYMLSYEIENNITVISFASPRVGNDDWKTAFNNKLNLNHFRVSNNRDIVTAAPMFNYKHVGHCIRLFDDDYRYYPEYSYNGWWEFSLFNCWRVSDHMCESYYHRLLKNVW
jgi:predicted lipase